MEKKKKLKRKPAKKKPAKKNKKSTSIIKLQNNLKKMEAELQQLKSADGKYNLVKSPLGEKQLLNIVQRTPANHIFKRPARGGGEWEYVTGTYIKKVLNYTFGWLWDSEVMGHGIVLNADGKQHQIWVLVKLIIKKENPNTHEVYSVITRTQVGGADIKMRKGTFTPLDFPNDFKAAITDGIKKCASELGIASDIYGKNEFKQTVEDEGKQEKPKNVTPEKSNNKLDDDIDYYVSLISEKKQFNYIHLRKIINENFKKKSENDLTDMEKKTLLILLKKEYEGCK